MVATLVHDCCVRRETVVILVRQVPRVTVATRETEDPVVSVDKMEFRDNL